MGKIERVILYVLAAALAVSLVVAFFSELLDRGEKIISISVIVHDEDDTQWKKFKMGMEQAALKYNAEVNFVTLYDRNDVEQQEELIEREVSNGAQAIILSPAGNEELVEALKDAPSNLPLILVRGRFTDAKVSREISTDQESMGYSLGMAMNGDGIKSCVLYRGDGAQSFIQDRLNGLTRAFEETGITYTIVEDRPGMEMDFLREAGAVAALDDSLTMELCEDRISGYYEKKVYGVGSSDQLLKYLDDGELEFLMFVNSYDEGYLSLQAAVQEINKEEKNGNTILKYYEIRREQIYQDQYQKLLFPAS